MSTLHRFEYDDSTNSLIEWVSDGSVFGRGLIRADRVDGLQRKVWFPWDQFQSRSEAAEVFLKVVQSKVDALEARLIHAKSVVNDLTSIIESSTMNPPLPQPQAQE